MILATPRLCRLVAIGLGVILSVPSSATETDWSEGDTGAAAGATREYYNGAAFLPWNEFMGDWRDRNDVPQGSRAYALASVVDDDTGKSVNWDVTDLVQQWIDGSHPNQGFFLRTVSDRGHIVFCSREHENKQWRPVLQFATGNAQHSMQSVADTFLDKSTYRSQGNADTLRVAPGAIHSLVRFDLSTLPKDTRFSKVVLRLHTTKQYSDATIGVFRCRQGHSAPVSKPIQGIAEKYPDDQHIANDPDVLMAADFEDARWADHWTHVGIIDVIDTTEADRERKFQPLRGKALRVRIAEGSNGALNTIWKYQSQTSGEPSESFFRYYLRLGDDWNQTRQGGKLPGFSGTYSKTGWGGRRSFGNEGWSARGLFKQTIPAGNPLAGRTPIGTYCYHADMKGNYGTNWLWQIGYRGYLETNRWYAIEQYVRLNTPGKNDGILRAWVDGRPAFEKTDIRFRNVDKLKIQQVWMNVYHGGTQPSPYDQHVYIDNVVIAKKYIGPIRSRSTK